jgi:hemolysin activation/secretion protein
MRLRCHLTIFRHLIIICCMAGVNGRLVGAEPVADSAANAGGVVESNAAQRISFAIEGGVLLSTNGGPRFAVEKYLVMGNSMLPAETIAKALTNIDGAFGTNVSVEQLVKAAAALHMEYARQGFPMMSVAIPLKEITNGIVTLNVFPTAVPQVVVSGQGVLKFTNTPEITIPEMTANPAGGVAAPEAKPPQTQPATHAASSIPESPIASASPAQIARAYDAVRKKMAELDAEEKDTRIHVVSTNGGPRFAVEKYLIAGNTALPPATMAEVLTNIDGDFGTNVSFDGVRTVVEELQRAYRERGYVTVAVGLPQQKLTNQTVKVQVTEGRLAVINVTGNHYFSSNNVMRALPSLHTNTLLNGPIFQAELNRANENRDRQIYPIIGPGLDPGTSALTLRVKDQLPLHAKMDFNNQNSPGTPDLRVNTSAEVDNLWQLNHSLGVQYGFSPQECKTGSQWPFYDEPLVANYSAFYRLPLGNPSSIENVVADNPGSFGYDEATRRFNLPPSSGAPELNVYGSRSTIDTGLENLLDTTLFDIPDVRQVSQQEVQQGITINQDVGFQLSTPLPQVNSLRSTVSGGLDFKTYEQDNYQTNIFTFIEYTRGPNQNLIERVSRDYLATPTTDQQMYYLPLGLNYNASLNNFMGTATLGLSLSANLWYSSSTLYPSSTNNLYGVKSLQGITGSSESSGHWVILRPSFSQNIIIHTNWVMTFHADGQWASEPLISTEQFGIGGVNSVRGYHEGEVFGDTGWHLSLEQQTPPLVVGMVHGNQSLIFRGSVYMDLAKAYLIDPEGRPGNIELWGTGFGFTASVGSHWQARFLFSVPLIGTSITPSDQPYFNFALTSQF